MAIAERVTMQPRTKMHLRMRPRRKTTRLDLLTDVSLLGHANPKKEGEYWLSTPLQQFTNVFFINFDSALAWDREQEIVHIAAIRDYVAMNAYSPHNTTQPRFLVDSLPEV